MAGIGYGLETMMPISLLIDRWFAYKKALALSICTIGSGLASIIFPPIIAAVIKEYHLSVAFFMLAASILLLGINDISFVA